nr:LysM peptidoglycan-binding domain-containing protein [Atopococcus tabaci]
MKGAVSKVEPAKKGDTYTVRSGDTLSEIAEDFGTTAKAIAEANGIKNPDKINVGQRLTIPKGSARKTYNITADGYMGPETVRALQDYFGLVADGEMWGQVRNQATLAFNQKAVRYGSGGSPVVRALQKKIGAKVDGYWGTNTTRALQRYLGTPVDGEVWRPSTAIKEMQRRLNAGTF